LGYRNKIHFGPRLSQAGRTNRPAGRLPNTA
jgi:hypothetical protein